MPPGISVKRVRAVIIVHDPGSLPALVGERLAHHGFDLVLHRVAPSLDDPVAHHDFPDPAEFELVVPLGAVWSVYDQATIGSWIGRELGFLRGAHEAGVPILGVCFGGQALAAAFGGEVSRAARPQIGWHDVDTDVPEVLAPGPWMQWHYDQFTPPPGAVELARDEVCSQAFRLGRHLGVQFHPEATGDHVANWIQLGGPAALEELAAQGYDPDALIDESYHRQEEAHPNVNRLVDWFLIEVSGLV